MRICSFFLFSALLLVLSACGDSDGDPSGAAPQNETAAVSPFPGDPVLSRLASFVPNDAAYVMLLDTAAVLDDPALFALLKNPALPFASGLKWFGAQGVKPEAFRGHALIFASGAASDSDYVCCLFSLSGNNADEIFHLMTDRLRIPSSDRDGVRTAELRHEDGRKMLSLGVFAPDLLQVLFLPGGSREAQLFEKRDALCRLAGHLDGAAAFSLAGDMDHLRDETRRMLPFFDPAMRLFTLSVLSGKDTLDGTARIAFDSASSEDVITGFASLIQSRVAAAVREDPDLARLVADFHARAEGRTALLSFRLNKESLLPRKKQERPDLCRANLSALSRALGAYRERTGAFPAESGIAGLTELRTEGLIDSSKVFTCPFSRKKPPMAGEPLDKRNCSYLYLSHGKNPDPSLPLLLELPGGRHRFSGFYVVNGDLSVRQVSVSPMPQTAEACLIAALGHEPASEAEKALLEQVRAWDSP